MTRGRSARLAHRGDWRAAPENTLAAFAAAMRVPACDGVEFDVRLSRDGVPVLLHDATLARVQGRPERVDELDAAVLATTGIPTLAQTLETLGPGPCVDVELKGDAHAGATADVLRAARGETGRRAVVMSFDPQSLASMARLLPGWSRWLGAMELDAHSVALARELGCGGISTDWATINPRTFCLAREAGLDVSAWTVRRRPTFDRLERLGVVAQCVEAAALDGPAA